MNAIFAVNLNIVIYVMNNICLTVIQQCVYNFAIQNHFMTSKLNNVRHVHLKYKIVNIATMPLCVIIVIKDFILVMIKNIAILIVNLINL